MLVTTWMIHVAAARDKAVSIVAYGGQRVHVTGAATSRTRAPSLMPCPPSVSGRLPRKRAKVMIPARANQFIVTPTDEKTKEMEIIKMA